MTYQIIWLPRALLELAAVWSAATNRNAVTMASNAIDNVLELDPHGADTHLFDTVYQFTLGPLGVEYEADDANRRVTVMACWSTATGRPNPTGN